MKSRDRKLAILRQLGQESEPITLSVLVSKLKLDFTERTIRRLLNDLSEEGLVQKIGHTKGVKYIAVKAPTQDRELALAALKESSPSKDFVSSCFSTESLSALKNISKPLFERQPISYNPDWLDSYEPNRNFYLPVNLRERLQLNGSRTDKNNPAGTYAHLIFNRLIIDLSYNSSRLEGNTYSLLDTERLLLHGDSAQGKLDEEKTMILNHKEAIRFLVDSAPRLEVCYNTICTIHYLLSDGLVEPQYAGKIRNYGVRIGGSTYIPFEDQKRLQLQLEKITKKAKLISNPFEQSIFLLIHLSYLQAFVDVNKRTARLAANISLIKENFVPLAFSDIPVQDYMSAMISIYELQDIRPLVDLYVYSYLRTCAAYDSTVKALGFDEVRVLYRIQRRQLIREILLKKLKGKNLDDFIHLETQNHISKEHQQEYIKDVLEDLQLIDESRLIGLGVTPEQLQDWLYQK